MTTVVVVRRPHEPPNKKTGIGMYSDEVENALKKNGSSLEIVPTSLDLKNGFCSAFFNGIIKPVFESKNLDDRNKIFHATDELCTIVFPFIKGKKIVTVHHVVKKTDAAPSITSLFWNIITKIGMKRADHVITVSSQTKREVMERFNISSDKISVIMTRIGEQYLKLPVPEKKEKIIACLGEFIERKNMSSAIRTFKMVLDMPGTSDFKLRICGKGEGYENLICLIKELGIENKVEFLSDLSKDRLIDFYSQATVFSNPSLHEGFGYATLEAQACSTPVVVFSDAEIPPEVTKFALHSKDEEDFAKNIHNLIMNDELRFKTIKIGRKYAQSFSNDFDGKLLDIYKNINQNK